MSRSRNLFVALMDGSMDSVLDIEGRPLGESPVLAEGGGVETEFRRCPYSDSRSKGDLMINYSALKQVGACWPEILSLLQAIRSEYLKKSGVSRIEQRDIWRIWQIALTMPDYLVSKNSYEGGSFAVPVWAAALFKVARGFGRLHGEIYFRELVGMSPGDPDLTGESIYRTADEGGNLISEFGACAGPKEMIVEAAELVALGKSAAGSKRIQVNDVVDSFDDYFRFASSSCDLLLVNFLFIAEQYNAVEKLKAVDQDAASMIVREMEKSEFGGERANNYPANVKGLAASLGGLGSEAFEGLKSKMLDLVAVDFTQVKGQIVGDLNFTGIGGADHLKEGESKDLFSELFREGERYLELLSLLMEKVGRTVGMVERHRICRSDIRRVYGILPSDIVIGEGRP
jgi:hypothetical protein